MPIYAYRCATCGNAQDVLQKMSDPVLTVCPACGAPTFEKQVTAAGFQLKGSGWYVTDFRGGNTGGAAKKDDGDAKPAAESGDAAKPAAEKAGDAKPAADAKAPAAAPKPAESKPASPAPPPSSGS